jgi:hypothetical protein
LYFDAEKEIFIGNQEANALLRTEYREGYRIPEQI